ncbi:MAG: hypothetical protein WB709_02125 [Solirubrobacteraceae bacterium]
MPVEQEARVLEAERTTSFEVRACKTSDPIVRKKDLTLVAPLTNES